MLHTSDYADTAVTEITPILPLSATGLHFVRLAARALFPGRSARQSLLGGRFHDRSNAR